MRSSCVIKPDSGRLKERGTNVSPETSRWLSGQNSIIIFYDKDSVDLILKSPHSPRDRQDEGM